MASDYCREVVVLGMEGTGKRSLCNSLLGRNAFEVTPFSFETVTQEVEKKSSVDVVVTNTPGLLDTEKSVADIALKILSDRNGCPYPHAFLIVFDVSKRIRKDCHRIMNLLRIMFGETCFSHVIVVFTMVNDKITDVEFQSFWKQNEDMQPLITACGSRVARIDNQGEENLMRAKEIVQLVDEVSDKGRKRFDLPFRSIHIDVLKNYQEKHGTMGAKRKYTINNQQNTNELCDKDVKQIADDLAEEYYRCSHQEKSLRLLMTTVVFTCAVVATGVRLLFLGNLAVGLAFLTSGLLGVIILICVSPTTIMKTTLKIEKRVRPMMLKFNEIYSGLDGEVKVNLFFLFSFLFCLIVCLVIVFVIYLFKENNS